jgi:hypothetical protein
VIARYGRKFFLSILVLATSIPLLALGLIGKGEFVTLVLGTCGVFMGSNVIQDFAGKTT